MNFNDVGDLIKISEKYNKRKKRHRVGNPEYIPYNPDLECLSKVIEPLKKLNNLIGMDSIKKNIIDQVLFFIQQLNTDEMMHTCLSGPPGVGKTTLGKILSEIYCSLGYLKTNNFRVVSKSDLIAGYIGQTSIKTLKVLKESIGGVLFIDEAYSLGNSDSYSKECIDTINQFLSEHTSNFILIIAGYREELDRSFFSINKGLARRFPWNYEIIQYTSDNLSEIFTYQITEGGWKLEPGLDINKLFLEFKTDELFSNNGGDTLILFDRAKIIHSRRVFGLPSNCKKILTETDLRNSLCSLKELKKKKQSTIPFGMYV